MSLWDPTTQLSTTQWGRLNSGGMSSRGVCGQEVESVGNLTKTELARREAALKQEETERAELAAEKLRRIREVDKLLEEEEDETPWGISWPTLGELFRFFYHVFAFWGLAIPWREKLRRRTLSRELDRTEAEDKLL